MSRAERTHCVRLRGRHNVWTTAPMPEAAARELARSLRLHCNRIGDGPEFLPDDFHALSGREALVRARDVTAIEWQPWVEPSAAEKPARADAADVTAAAAAAADAGADGGVVAGGTEFLRHLTRRAHTPTDRRTATR